MHRPPHLLLTREPDAPATATRCVDFPASPGAVRRELQPGTEKNVLTEKNWPENGSSMQMPSRQRARGA
jgi:hypothetical protein